MKKIGLSLGTSLLLSERSGSFYCNAANDSEQDEIKESLQQYYEMDEESTKALGARVVITIRMRLQVQKTKDSMRILVPKYRYLYDKALCTGFQLLSGTIALITKGAQDSESGIKRTVLELASRKQTSPSVAALTKL
ncbi:hypothetical protein NPIL_361411 [Nephila pilipes]|uniref:Uncharacterized protein n=1 Tax=Nephila pilipes TaxID=299642 RepID=A0A8X6MZ19_NEPPI|nr:hypothetical protein NPIL_361411 [Nephila pilipes]